MMVFKVFLILLIASFTRAESSEDEEDIASEQTLNTFEEQKDMGFLLANLEDLSGVYNIIDLAEKLEYSEDIQPYIDLMKMELENLQTFEDFSNETLEQFFDCINWYGYTETYLNQLYQDGKYEEMKKDFDDMDYDLMCTLSCFGDAQGIDYGLLDSVWKFINAVVENYEGDREEADYIESKQECSNLMVMTSCQKIAASLYCLTDQWN